MYHRIVQLGLVLTVLLLSLLLGGCAGMRSRPCTPSVYSLRADSTIELSVNGVAGHFLLDTGANVSAIEPDWARAIAARHNGEEVVVPQLQVGGLSFPRARFRIESLAASYVGTLGTDILRSFIVTFDYRTGRVELSPKSERAVCTPDRERHDQVPFSFLQAVPAVAVRLGDKTIRALLDTGAWYDFIGIKRSLIDQLTDQLNFAKNVQVLSSRGRKVQPSFLGLPIHIGSVEVHAPIVEDDANIVGLYVLRRFGRFTIDFANNSLWVERGRQS